MKAVRGLAPALILLDLMMPAVTGNDILDELIHAGDRTPVLLMTGWIGRLREELRVRVTGVLEKPVTARQLIEAVETALSEAGTGHAAHETEAEGAAAAGPGAAARIENGRRWRQMGGGA
jgi:FixJ family two-component response regulator